MTFSALAIATMREIPGWARHDSVVIRTIITSRAQHAGRIPFGRYVPRLARSRVGGIAAVSARARATLGLAALGERCDGTGDRKLGCLRAGKTGRTLCACPCPPEAIIPWITRQKLSMVEIGACETWWARQAGGEIVFISIETRWAWARDFFRSTYVTRGTGKTCTVA